MLLPFLDRIRNRPIRTRTNRTNWLPSLITRGIPRTKRFNNIYKEELLTLSLGSEVPPIRSLSVALSRPSP